jgi:pyruvate dehydrogenase (quinone)
VPFRHLVDRAIRIAKAERTVTCIILPNDVQEMSAVPEPARAHGTVHSGVGYSSPRVVPKDWDLRLAADILNSGKKVAMLVGAGALQASDEVMKVAEALGAGVSKALLGKAVIPDDLPYCCGPTGHGRRHVQGRDPKLFTRKEITRLMPEFLAGRESQSPW